MQITVRVSSLELFHCKNVVHGKFYFPCSKSRTMKRADVLGMYGQNGTGKSAAVSAFQLLQVLLHGQALEPDAVRLIDQQADCARFLFTFLVCMDRRYYELVYAFTLSKQDLDADDAVDLANDRVYDPVFVAHEEIRYKELVKGARYRTLISFSMDGGEARVSPNAAAAKLRSGKDDRMVAFRVNVAMAVQRRTSVLFCEQGFELLQHAFDQQALGLLHALKRVFASRLFVLNNRESGLSLANMSIPIHCPVEADRSYKIVAFPINQPKWVDHATHGTLRHVLRAISKVLRELVPGLTVEARPLRQTTNERHKGVYIELAVKRGGRLLPIDCESDGVKKLLTILSALVVMYNDENACVVIDELDAGIYEFLLGEIVKILNDGGKGQLLFTSHNLRLLEVLERENLVFTSANPENRYIVLRGIRERSNIRDMYIRAIQLGHDGEEVYEPTDRCMIMEAFDEAGEFGHGR
ncbi:ATP-binding protein [Sporolactobacillus sp. CPB3-1]|uniref:ATP-binding protein n=1 Tax=Sporolactobacillus mangiferae TaxID=2940498 RepID=A0ABT0MCV1_9BACL|nr:AAA family ATPase [Sporolactobacillus mangiferae]MCL1632688.1 ATP-binding protein [Sporolactobacillus mangiferae]